MLTPIRAVVDTSALYSVQQRIELQQLAAAGSFTAIWSPWITSELSRVLTWRWLEKTRDFSDANWRACSKASGAMITLLLATFELVAPVPPYPDAWDELLDPNDHPIWATAKLGHARYVVSENTSDFPPVDADGRHAHEGIEYLRGADFIQLLSETL